MPRDKYMCLIVFHHAQSLGPEHLGAVASQAQQP
jgi:hypothetical protein